MKQTYLLLQNVLLTGFFLVISPACNVNTDLKKEPIDSPYFRNVEWGSFPGIDPSRETEHYLQDQLYSFSESTTTEQVYQEFAHLESEFPSLIHSRIAGYASNNQELKYYTIGRNNNGNVPIIIIICAQHGFEKNSTFGTYIMVQRLLSGDSTFMEYLRDNIRLIIVPVANPSGFNKRSYKNANRVNLNRNWPVLGWERISDNISDKDFGGQIPLDQPETQAIADIISQNRDAVLLLDFHTYGGGIVESIRQINTLIIPTVNDDSFFEGIYKSAEMHQRRISSLFYAKFGRGRPLFDENPRVGAISTCDYYRKKGCLNNYGCQQRIISLTFEGFNGFPGDTQPFTKEVAEANADLLQIFLYSFCEQFVIDD